MCLNLFSRVQHVCPICELESRLSVIPGRRSTMRRGPEEVVTVIAVGRATTCAALKDINLAQLSKWYGIESDQFFRFPKIWVPKNIHFIYIYIYIFGFSMK